MIELGVIVLVAAAMLGIVKLVSLSRHIEELHRRLNHVEDELYRLGNLADERAGRATPSASPTPAKLSKVYPAAPVPPPLPTMRPEILSPQRAPQAPPVPPPMPGVVMAQTAAPPVMPGGPAPEPASSAPPVAAAPAPPEWLNWENFLGVKLFAWVGGLALFLGVAFFVKWSFDRNLITPLMRVIIGGVTGVGLIAGGLRMPRPRYMVMAQTLCATGTVVLYADSFAAHAYYGFIGATPAFALMALITVVAFMLAVRFDAQVIALLGVLGGFLTPPMLSTGRDHPVGLFGYLALLDAGLIAVALRKQWNYLIALAAGATVFMEWGWVNEYFAPEKLGIAMTVFLGFAGLFVGALAAAQRSGQADRWSSTAAVLMPAMALGFALYLMGQPGVPGRFWLLFGFIFVADVLWLATAWLREELRVVHLTAGGAVFLLLMRWTVEHLTVDLLTPALVCYLVFAVLHSVLPFVLQRVKPSSLPVAWAHLFPSMALVLILVPLSKLAESSFLVWPVVLLIDLVAIGMAMLTAALPAILAVFALTVVATALWICQLPPDVTEVPGMLVVIGGFAIFFMAAAVFAARKVGAAPDPDNAAPADRGIFAQLTAVTAALPFLLLTLVVLRLRLENPAPVFGLAALLCVVLLAVTRLLAVPWLPAVGLGSALLVEWTWHFERYRAEHFVPAMGWYLGFSALFLVFPFLFRKRFASWTGPWAAAALALPLHFTILHHALHTYAPGFGYPGLLPLALAAPCAVGLWRLVQPRPVEGRERLAQVALFGAVTLFFVTLIFPVQFDRQWVTIGWALEGTALLWLFHRVPHPGLRLAGVALLVAGFVRLALNPWVFTAYGRTGTPILNWYLYAYGIVAAAELAGAWLLRAPRDRIGVGELRAPPLLCALGTVLAFMLLNIEIADGFSARGGPLVFHLSASFEQDMTYSLAWGLFALGMLAIGLVWRNAPTRYAGMTLLVVTLLKLFLHDLWRLGGLSRVGSLVGLAVVLLVVSLIYQRFLASVATGSKKEEPAP